MPFSTTGRRRFTARASRSSSATGSSVFDFEADGAAEVVYNDECFLRAYEGATGRVLFQVPNSSRTATEYPVIVDVDTDGTNSWLTVKEHAFPKLVRQHDPEMAALERDMIAIRRAALKDGNRAVGFPTIAFPCEMASNLDAETMLAAMFVAKYGSIVVMSDFAGESVFPLLLERLNIFTDPQRPMTVTEGIYEIGNPDENSPILVTTNFALTYFIVSGEVEGSKVPTWLLIGCTLVFGFFTSLSVGVAEAAARMLLGVAP